MGKFWEIDWPAVISAAAQSPLGIVALVVIVLSILVFFLFGKSHPVAQLLAFAMLIGGIVAMAFIMQENASIQLDEIALKKALTNCETQREIVSDSCVAYDKSGFHSSPSARCSLSLAAGDGRFFADLSVKVTQEDYRNISGAPAGQSMKPTMKNINGISVPIGFTGSIGCTNSSGTGRTCESKATVQAESYPESCIDYHKELRR